MSRKLAYHLFFLCIQCILADDITDTFEFGTNSGKVSFSASGSIGNLIMDKVTTIPIDVPDCAEPSYVRVDVRNALGPPFVKFDENINAVIIKYRPLQYSVSTYVITAKTKPVLCDKSGRHAMKTII